MADLALVFDDLIRFETELWNTVDARLRRELALTLGWFEGLRLIERTPGCRVQDIARSLSITVGGASKLVDRIEAAGLCVRTSHPADGRSSVLTLTAAGAELLPRARSVFDDELERRLATVLAADQLDDFAATLAALRAAGVHHERTAQP